MNHWITATIVVWLLAFAMLGVNLYQYDEALKDTEIALAACYFGAKP